MSAYIEPLIHRLRTGTSTVELIHVPHDRWPLPKASTRSVRQDAAVMRVGVLDSSFNPPTLAHRALASVPLTRRPRGTQDVVLDPSCSGARDSADPIPTSTACCDARLLLLSVRNADKALKPTDATYVQRLDMMVLLAQDIMNESERRQAADYSAGPDGRDNVAVAIVDEPTFVGKSSILRQFLQERLSRLYDIHVHRNKVEGTPSTGDRADVDTPPSIARPPRPQISFVVGIDTLERILSPRYYPSETMMRDSLRQFLSPDGDDSHLVCARRITTGLLQPPDERERDMWRLAEKYIDPNWVTMVDIEDKLQAYSSSEVRERIGGAIPDTLWKTMVTNNVAEFIEEHGLYSSRNDPTSTPQ